MYYKKRFLHNNTLLILCEIEIFNGEANACVADNEMSTKGDHVQMRGISRIIAGTKSGIRYPYGYGNQRLHIPYGEIFLLCEYSHGSICVIDENFPNIFKAFVKIVTDESVKFGTITRQKSSPFSLSEKDNAFILARCCVEHISDAILYDNTEQLQKVQTDFQNAFLNPNFGDTSININGKTLHVHKDILSVHSPVFAAMFNQEWRESSIHVVTVEDFKFQTILAMVAYIYSSGGGNVCQEEADPVELLQAADKYQLNHLKGKCEQRLCEILNSDNLFNLINLTSNYDLPLLKSAASVFANDRRHLSFN